MTLNIGGLQFESSLAGLENYDNIFFNFSVTGHSLAVFGVTRWVSSWPIANVDAISSTQIQYTLDNVWRYMSGVIALNYNSDTYQVETITYYQGGLYHVETYVINQSPGTVAIPQFFVNVKVSLFNAPF